MYREALQQVGLSKNEAKIYEALLNIGVANISAISSASKVNRRNVYDSLDGLLAQNLVVIVRYKGGQQYKPAEPKRLYEILNSQKQQIAKQLEDLKKIYSSKLPLEQAYISKGSEGIKNFWNFVMSQKEPVYFVGGKGAWHDAELEEERKNYFRTLKRKNIEIRGIFDHLVYFRQKEVYANYDPRLIRFFPKLYGTQASFDICGDRVVIFPMPREKSVHNATIFNIISQELADSYRKWFDLMWRLAIPLSKMKHGRKGS